MEVKDIKEKLERGEKIYYAYFWEYNFWANDGWGETRIYVLTPDSKPSFKLTIDENKRLGYIREIDERKIYRYYSRYEGSSVFGYYRRNGIIFSEEPFVLYIRHREWKTKSRLGNKDELIKSEEISSLEEFLNLLE